MNNVANPLQSIPGLCFCPGLLGLERGFQRAIGRQIHPICHVEIEAFIVENLLAGMESGFLVPAPIWTNAVTFNARPFRGLVDVILAGYPCPPFSNAGQRKGTDDPRHLYPYIERAIDTIRPFCVILENVSGHLSLGFDTVVQSLHRMGYSVEAGLYTASEVGAPHKRARLFIVAILAHARRPEWWPVDPGGLGGSTRGKHLHGQGAQGANRFAERGKDVADADGEGIGGAIGFVRGQEWRPVGGLQQQPDGPGTEVADPCGHGPGTDAGGIGQAGGAHEGEAHGQEWDQAFRQWSGGNPGDGGPEGGLAYADVQGLEERGKQPAWEERQTAERNGADRWPAGPGDPQQAWESPRTIKHPLGITINGNELETNTLYLNYERSKISSAEKMHVLWGKINKKEVWESPGGPWCFLEEEILFDILLSNFTPQKFYVYIHSKATCPDAIETSVRGMRSQNGAGYPSQRQESTKQCAEEFADALRIMSYQIALARGKTIPKETMFGRMQNMWESAEQVEIRNVSKALPAFQKVWQSPIDEAKDRDTFFRACREYVRELNPVELRQDLLRALGNSVVEQQAEFGIIDLIYKHFSNESIAARNLR